MAGPVKVRQNHGLHRQRPVTTSEIMDLDDDVTEPTDLKLLKEVSERLNLATRRPSTVQWKQVIEFRKSMGLYSSDVEPEFLDKIVEAKMKSDSHKSSPQSSPLVKGKNFARKENKTKPKKDDEINNNVKTKTPRSRRTKLERDVESSTKKNGFSLPSFHHHKNKTKPKKLKSKSGKNAEQSIDTLAAEPAVKETVAQDSNCVNQTQAVAALVETEPVHCDATIAGKVGGNGDEGDEKVTRFPLYCTDDENEEETKGMSQMAIRHRSITRMLGKIRRDLIIMRMEDNKLARKLLDARSEMNLIRCHQSCDAHAEMLDEVTYELEEEDLLPGLIKACDLPSRPPGSLLTAFSPLRNIGVSRMNLNRRRFSIR